FTQNLHKSFPFRYLRNPLIRPNITYVRSVAVNEHSLPNVGGGAAADEDDVSVPPMIPSQLTTLHSALDNGIVSSKDVAHDPATAAGGTNWSNSSQLYSLLSRPGYCDLSC
ncbi:hypothetical protein CUMW_279140, partial [Citrus unshiu]